MYSVAMSLDGYIAGSNGESDWIVMDPEIDFRAIFARFDTILLGRTTYETTRRRRRRHAWREVLCLFADLAASRLPAASLSRTIRQRLSRR